ncbi:hypothetical protein FDF78_17785, partial [Clostridium sporogenes]|uniref:hypothetical protein n=1 Tax=Clostridium sporogenes TaxID=1509 RepID=UPI0013D1CEC5
MKNKFIDIFEEETYIENDERINEIYNKIYKEQYNIIYLFLSIWYLYELMILQKNDTPLILFIVLDGIYIDIRLAMKKAYIKTSLKYITSFAWVLLLLKYFKYKFLININLIIIAIISFIICY